MKKGDGIRRDMRSFTVIMKNKRKSTGLSAKISRLRSDDNQRGIKNYARNHNAVKRESQTPVDADYHGGTKTRRIRHGSKVVVARAAAGIASGCSRVEKRIQVPISAVHGGCEPELALLLTDRR
ncbi:hypothetical protein An02g02160, partial [Aspergillus niger]|uniref:Uncharacterized protein n=2 Tax=Aspergillus niger TaxID=5061 RepID=A0AAJ8E3F7_ASPNG